MKWIKWLAIALASIYFLIAFLFTLIVVVLGGNILTAFAVGIQWPRIFWRR